MTFSEEEYEDYAAMYNNVMEELKKEPEESSSEAPVLDDYDLIAYNKLRIDFEYIVELLQGVVEIFRQTKR
ncbi:MAG: type I restriction endonuclease subunit R, EcoR124 family [Anaerobutyricum hallii]